MIADGRTEKLTHLLCQRYAEMPNGERVNTGDLARAVLIVIDPQEQSPGLVSHAAYLELKQLARAICRRRHAEEESVAETQSLFDFHLQARYPASHAEEEDADDYLPLALMAKEDFDYNIRRLESEATAKLRHADALRQERDARINQGMLVEKRSA